MSKSRSSPTRALLSVSDKSGIVELARGLVGLGVEVVSTGGTAQLLHKEGVPVTEVASVTGFPEMLDGRVKTLHPKVHGGLLARRELPAHMAAIREAGIAPIDLVAVNLYPFQATVADPSCRLEDAVENIDIGGPAMLRSAAKNYGSVAVLVDPADYGRVLEELRGGGISAETRFALAKKAFAHTAAYDGAIANYLTSLGGGYPEVLTLQFHKLQDLRYGENPHQSAAFYGEARPAAGSLARLRQTQGKELSYNNIADADAAWECAKSFGEPACVIVKHANPCGVAVGASLREAYDKAFQTDPVSAFGGILAFIFSWNNFLFSIVLAGALAVLSASPSMAQAPAPEAKVVYIHAGALLDRPGNAPRGASCADSSPSSVAALRLLSTRFSSASSSWFAGSIS